MLTEGMFLAQLSSFAGMSVW